MVSPRWSGRVMSSLEVWVIDQVSPWFTPSSTVAATIQFQLGAQSTRRNRNRRKPAQEQYLLAADAFRQAACDEIERALHEAEGDHERGKQNEGIARHAEFGFRERRHDRAHHADGEPDQQDLQQLVQELVEVVADAV